MHGHQRRAPHFEPVKDLDGWERYRKAGITVIDARTGMVFSANSSET